MHRTRILRSKVLIPPESFWDVASSAMQGAWAQLTDRSSNQNYEKAVADGVIKDGVLSQARHGSMLTMALFHNLQTPLFEKYQFNAKEFLDAVGPALENYHDTLACLVADMNTDEDSKLDPSHVLLKDSLSKKDNPWRKQAEADPNSKAAQFVRMTKDSNLDEHYYGARLFQALTGGSSKSMMRYVPGSCEVKQVALLSARAVEMDYNESDKEQSEEYLEFEESKPKNSVAARIDILYEISQTYEDTGSLSSPLSSAAQYRTIADAEEKTPSPSATTTTDASIGSLDEEKRPLEELEAELEKIHAENDKKFKLFEQLLNANLYREKTPFEKRLRNLRRKKVHVGRRSNRIVASNTNASNDPAKLSNAAKGVTEQFDIKDLAAKINDELANLIKQPAQEANTKATPLEKRLQRLRSRKRRQRSSHHRYKMHSQPEKKVAPWLVRRLNATKASQSPKTLSDDSTSTASTSASSTADKGSKVNATGNVKTKSDAKTFTEPTLAVAVFEGWLHGGPDNKELRWEVAMVRDAFEFNS